MFLGLGTGTLAGITAGMFHLFTHAFFKALLFLGAGSVMHAMGGVIDIRQLGGLRRRCPPPTGPSCSAVWPWPGSPLRGLLQQGPDSRGAHARGRRKAGGFALYHLPLSGRGLHRGTDGLLCLPRLLLTFFGAGADSRGGWRPRPRVAPHNDRGRWWCWRSSRWWSAAYFEWTRQIPEFLAETPSLAAAQGTPYAPREDVRHAERDEYEAAESGHFQVALTGTAVVGLGIAAAWLLYRKPNGLLRRLTALLDILALYRLASGKFYFDELYCLFIVWPLEQTARLLAWIDRWIIDGLVDFSAACRERSAPPCGCSRAA